MNELEVNVGYLDALWLCGDGKCEFGSLEIKYSSNDCLTQLSMNQPHAPI